MDRERVKVRVGRVLCCRHGGFMYFKYSKGDGFSVSLSLRCHVSCFLPPPLLRLRSSPSFFFRPGHRWTCTLNGHFPSAPPFFFLIIWNDG